MREDVHLEDVMRQKGYTLRITVYRSGGADVEVQNSDLGINLSLSGEDAYLVACQALVAAEQKRKGGKT